MDPDFKGSKKARKAERADRKRSEEKGDLAALKAEIWGCAKDEIASQALMAFKGPSSSLTPNYRREENTAFEDREISPNNLIFMSN